MKVTSVCAALTLMVLVSCGKQDKVSMATGIFESTETTVSAEQSGRLVRFDVAEGQRLTLGQEVGLVDTVPLSLKMAQVGATRQVYGAQRPDVETQVADIEQQLAKARMELRRYSELVADGAAPGKALDDARSQVAVLQKQLAARRSALNTPVGTLASQQRATDTERAWLSDQIAKCHIKAPQGGEVLEKYVEPGEVIAAGKPLFKMADTRTMYLRAYVTSAQLADLRVGQRVKVSTDYGDSRGKHYEGTITWISAKSELCRRDGISRPCAS